MTILFESLVDAPHVVDVTLPASASPVLETSGPFEIRLTNGGKLLRQAQRLRYGVFFQDGGAVASAAAVATQRDLCPFDRICDHLVVVDTEAVARSGRRKPRVVGTYRLLRREVADRNGGFYSQSEFDLKPLLAAHPGARLLELGRSCVHPDYRAKRVIELLWRGLWLYASRHAVDALIGCASLPGTDPVALEPQLSFLTTHARAEADWLVAALPHRAARFVPRPAEEIDARRALAQLPPLVKAYLRTGARFGCDAVIDHQFGTTDVFAIMAMADIEERYLAHYGQPSCVSGAPDA